MEYRSYNVYLYGLIPKAIPNLLTWLNQEFQKINKQDCLVQFKQIVDFEVLYDPVQLGQLLKIEEVLLVEFDSMLLREVLLQIEIDEWKFDNNMERKQFLQDIALIDGINYGIPRLICSQFLFTYDKDLAAATDIEQFISIVQERGVYIPFEKDFYFVAYFQLYSKIYPEATTKDIVDKFTNSDLDEAVLNTLKQLFTQQRNGKYVNTGKTEYQNQVQELQDFKNGKIKGWVGYYESISNYDMINQDGLIITNFPPGNRPFIMSDILVRKKGLNDLEKILTDQIANFLTDVSIQLGMTLGEDSNYESQRYVLVSTKEAYENPSINLCWTVRFNSKQLNAKVKKGTQLKTQERNT